MSRINRDFPTLWDQPHFFYSFTLWIRIMRTARRCVLMRPLRDRSPQRGLQRQLRVKGWSPSIRDTYLFVFLQGVMALLYSKARWNGGFEEIRSPSGLKKIKINPNGYAANPAHHQPPGPNISNNDHWGPITGVCVCVCCMLPSLFIQSRSKPWHEASSVGVWRAFF